MLPTKDDLVVVYNAGGPRFGHAPLGWQDFWENRASQHQFVILHNIGGHYTKPMQFNQLSRAKQYYAKESWTDYKLMAKYARKRTDFKALYLGSPETLKPLDGELDRKWLSRAVDEIRDIIEARPDILFFDAFQEINQYRYLLLIDRLQTSYNITLGTEPCIYEDQQFMYNWPIAIQTEFILQRQQNNGWNTGKNAARPLRVPINHPIVFELVRSDFVKDDVMNARLRGHVPSVNIGHLNKVL